MASKGIYEKDKAIAIKETAMRAISTNSRPRSF